MGQDAEDAVEAARAHVATLIGAEPREIAFTSGATEANNIAIKGAVRFAASQGSTRRRVITVATEHKCVLESVADLAHEGFEAIVLPVRHDGLLDPAMLEQAMAVPTMLVSVMAANNETGVLQDLPGLAAIARAAGALFHTDAAQMLGKLPFGVDGIDLASFSAHKAYGPKGVGALYVRRRPRVRLQPLFSGGGQERGVRSGTLPTPLVVGFGEACRIAGQEMADEAARLANLRNHLLDRLTARLPGLRVNGSMTQAAARQPQRHLARSRGARRHARCARIMRLDRVRLLVRRDRAVLRVGGDGRGRCRSGTKLANWPGTLYLPRRRGLRHPGAVRQRAPCRGPSSPCPR